MIQIKNNQHSKIDMLDKKYSINYFMSDSFHTVISATIVLQGIIKYISFSENVIILLRQNSF